MPPSLKQVAAVMQRELAAARPDPAFRRKPDPEPGPHPAEAEIARREAELVAHAASVDVQLEVHAATVDAKLDDANRKTEARLTALAATLEENERALEDRERDLVERERILAEATAAFKEEVAELGLRISGSRSKEERLAALSSELIEREGMVQHREEGLQRGSEQIEARERRVEELDREVTERETEVALANDSLAGREAAVVAAEGQLISREARLDERERLIERKAGRVAEREGRVATVEKEWVLDQVEAKATEDSIEKTGIRVQPKGHYALILCFGDVSLAIPIAIPIEGSLLITRTNLQKLPSRAQDASGFRLLKADAYHAQIQALQKALHSAGSTYGVEDYGRGIDLHQSALAGCARILEVPAHYRSISRLHAAVEAPGDGSILRIHPLGITTINGARVNETCDLRSEDRLSIGYPGQGVNFIVRSI